MVRKGVLRRSGHVWIPYVDSSLACVTAFDHVKIVKSLVVRVNSHVLGRSTQGTTEGPTTWPREASTQ